MAGLTRRRFLGYTLLGGLVLALGGLFARRRAAGRPEAAGQVLSARQMAVLAAVCRCVLEPDQPGVVSPDELGTSQIIDRLLSGLPHELASQIAALLELVEHTPLLFAGRWGRFSRLAPTDQTRVLESWQSSRFDFARAGFRALKALAAFGYYGHPRTFAILDYIGPMFPDPRAGQT